MAATAGSFLVCRFAISRSWLQNRVVARSSHNVPTSRAGGLAIMGAFVAVALCLSLVSGIPDANGMALVIFSTGAALLGLADDLWSPSPLIKFAGQTVLAIAATLVVGQVNTLPLPLLGAVPLGAFGFLITVIWIVAFTNVFNFMDGLNGIAGGCAVVALLAMAIACAGSSQAGLSALCLIAAAATCGFLLLNVPHGKIFLGDTGSHGLGFLLAVLAVSAGGIQGSPGSVDAVFLPIIFLPFILDVTVTLANRALRCEKLHQAHKEHIYQRLNQRGMSHIQVASIYVGLCTISAVLAFVTQRLDPGLKFLAPLALTCFFLAAALVILSGKNSLEEQSGRAGD